MTHTPPPFERYTPPPRQQPPHQRYTPPQGPYVRPENTQQQQPWPPAQGHYEQPQPQQRRAAVAPVAARNGLGLAAVIVAPIGILFGLIPLTGFVAVAAGLVAIPLALAGWSRVRKGVATNGKTAITGLVLGIVALALGIWGITIMFGAVDKLANDLSGPAPLPPGATAPASDGSSNTPATATFGQRVTYENGLAVEVTAPQAYRPGQYSVGHDRDRAIRFEVTIVNGSSEQIDAITAVVRGTHDGRDAPMIFDSAKGLNGPPQGVILPGNSITFPVALSIGKEPGALQVDVTPGFLSDPAVFTGNI